MKFSKKKLDAASRVVVAILRHTAVEKGIPVQAGGWVRVDDLLKEIHTITKDELVEIVRIESKQRLALSDDQRHIRANQGHSFPVDLQLAPKQPPEQLLHGTKPHALAAIKTTGLSKMTRHAVHLTDQASVAHQVGGRKIQEAPVVLRVSALKMHQEGYVFYQTDNDVWLTDHVPPQYIEFPSE